VQVLELADVRLDGDRLALRVLDLVDRVLEGHRVAGRQDDLRPAFGRQLGRRQADAARRARDDHDLLVQRPEPEVLDGHERPPSCRCWKCGERHPGRPLPLFAAIAGAGADEPAASRGFAPPCAAVTRLNGRPPTPEHPHSGGRGRSIAQHESGPGSTPPGPAQFIFVQGGRVSGGSRDGPSGSPLVAAAATATAAVAAATAAAVTAAAATAAAVAAAAATTAAAVAAAATTAAAVAAATAAVA